MQDDIIRFLSLQIAFICVRNNLEPFHSGEYPETETGDYSDVKVVTPKREIPWDEMPKCLDDEAMKKLMKKIVNEIYSFLVLFDSLPQEEHDTLMTKYDASREEQKNSSYSWDEPKLDKKFLESTYKYIFECVQGLK